MERQGTSDLRGMANDGLHSVANTVSSQLHKINNSEVAAQARGMASLLKSKIASKLRSKVRNPDDERVVVLSAEDAARITELHRRIEEMAEQLKDGSVVVDEYWLHEFTEVHRRYMESCSCQGVDFGGDLTGTTDFLQFVLLHPTVQALLRKMDTKKSPSESEERTLSNVRRFSDVSVEALEEIAGSQAILANADVEEEDEEAACPEVAGAEAAEVDSASAEAAAAEAADAGAAGVEAAGAEAAAGATVEADGVEAGCAVAVADAPVVGSASIKSGASEKKMASAGEVIVEGSSPDANDPQMISAEGAIDKPCGTESPKAASTEGASFEAASTDTPSAAEVVDPEEVSAKGDSTEGSNTTDAIVESSSCETVGAASATAAALQASNADVASAEAINAEVAGASAEASNAEAASSETANAHADTVEACSAEASDVANSQGTAEASSPSKEPQRVPGHGRVKPKTGGYPEGDQELQKKLEAMRNRMAGGARDSSPRSRRPARSEEIADGAHRTMQEKIAARRAKLEARQCDEEEF